MGNVLEQWHVHVQEFIAGEWTIVEVDLNLEGAITLVATLRGDFHSPGHPLVADDATIAWRLEDSLNGRDWYHLEIGSLTQDNPKAIARVSAPIGTLARVSLLVEVPEARWTPGEGELPPGGVHVDVAVRLI